MPSRRVAKRCAGGFRRSRACGSVHKNACRASASISSTAAPTTNTASSATPTRSRRSSCCRATASTRQGISTEVELFGRNYAAPIGVAPMGSAGLMWPGAEKLFAARGAAPEHPLCAGDPGQRLDRGDRGDRAGRVLVPALPLSVKTITPSPSISCAAPTRPARMCWCRPSTAPANRNARATSATAPGCRSRSIPGPPIRC